MAADRSELLQKLPKVDEVLRRPAVAALTGPRWAVVEAVRRGIEARRQAILAGEAEATDLGDDEVAQRAKDLLRPSLRRVINATGVVLHTNFGRAPLAAAALARVAELGGRYSNLEYDIDGRARGSRHSHLTQILCQLTGAEDAVVVNNNAGAVMLALAALAAGREVVVSRGELIEIGGSFRVPDVMRLSGARLVEVGTTNKTHLRDYESAISDATALLLKVHRSNFAIVGFTHEVELGELAALGRAHGVPVMIDLGSGSLVSSAELARAGLPPEPSVRQTVATGVGLATFSGDKLLGGPQAGVLVGAGALVAAARKHPLMRALRPDKLTLAALEATLAVYRDEGADAVSAIPALAMLTAPVDLLRRRAEAVLAGLGDRDPNAWVVIDIAACTSAVGGGALPTAELPSFAVVVQPAQSGRPGCSATAIDRKLRAMDPPVIGRIADDALVLDVRTVADDELATVVTALRTL
jgi:L-seryl-tRNA(Ser) seleniumtransferase